MSRRPYPAKPRFLGQPLWWWLGGPNKGLDKYFPSPRPRRSFAKRIGTIWRRGWGIRPRPIVSIKETYERGRKGYTLSDTWSLDSYLVSWLPEAIADLRAGAYGHPVGVCDHEHDGSDNDKPCDGPEKWAEILTTIQRGFVAAREINDMDYYDIKAPPEENRAREAALVVEFEKGMALFTKWFFGLWN